jgi:hypothetical protein
MCYKPIKLYIISVFLSHIEYMQCYIRRNSKSFIFNVDHAYFSLEYRRHKMPPPSHCHCHCHPGGRKKKERKNANLHGLRFYKLCKWLKADYTYNAMHDIGSSHKGWLQMSHTSNLSNIPSVTLGMGLRHPSTNWVQQCYTFVIVWEPVY